MTLQITVTGGMTVRKVDSDGNETVESHDVSFGTHVGEGDVGARRCGLPFNPSNDTRVTRIKVLAAALMNEIEAQKIALKEDPYGDGPRCMATAMTDLEGAQMFAVKGLFAANNAR